jgi:hypothetical protein
MHNERQEGELYFSYQKKENSDLKMDKSFFGMNIPRQKELAKNSQR